MIFETSCWYLPKKVENFFVKNCYESYDSFLVASPPPPSNPRWQFPELSQWCQRVKYRDGLEKSFEPPGDTCFSKDRTQ